MRDLLFLAHRIPYPPDKGDKIRSFNLLKGLAGHYRVHLGSFVDDPADLQHVPRLKDLCASVYVPRLRPMLGQMRGMPATVRGAPLSLARYVRRDFAHWVDRTLCDNRISRVFAFSSAMGAYGLRQASQDVRRVMDFVDVDSEKWRQYAERTRGPMRAVYAREYRTLAAEEARLATAYDAVIFVSNEEANLFIDRNPAAASWVHGIGNGVDAAYFDPSIAHPSPFDSTEDPVVFTGAMDYQANVDGVRWFSEQVWPQVQAAWPRARFYIVGQRPTAAVRALGDREGIRITGRVPDIRPYLAHAAVICAPLQVARGVQNKVIEALAMGRPVVGTHAAWEGLGPFSQVLGASVSAPDAFARQVLEHLSKPDARDEQRRRLVVERFSWSHSVDRCLELLDGSAGRGELERRFVS